MACLDDDTLLALGAGQLTGQALEDAERHVDGCVSCRRALAMGLQSSTGEALRQPVLSVGNTIGRYVVLERVGADRQALWCPIIEEPLGGAVVVGRGGVELHLRSVRILDRRVAALVGLADRVGTAPSRNQLVTSAESPGWGAEHPAGLVGAAVGTAGPDGAALERIVVDTGHRSKGVARQVLSAWILAAGRRGAGVVTARFEETARAGVLESLGFVKLDSATWCRRVGQAR